MRDEEHWEVRPRFGRLLLGFTIAPLLPSFLFSWMTGLSVVFPLAWAYAAALLLGIPTFLTLAGWLRPGIATIVFVGGFLAAAPSLLLFAVPSEFAQIGTRVVARDGVTTWYGYLENAKLFGMIFAYGALGGLVFWACIVPSRRSDRLSAR